MADVPQAFDSMEQAEEFKQRLTDLLAEYPSLLSRMQRSYESDPSSGYWEVNDPSMTRPYDPQSPVWITGWVLVMATSNMEGWEDMTVIAPRGLSSYQEQGMLRSAAEVVSG